MYEFRKYDGIEYTGDIGSIGDVGPTGTSSLDSWLITGNIVLETNFIGTLNNVSLKMKVFNVDALQLQLCKE